MTAMASIPLSISADAPVPQARTQDPTSLSAEGRRFYYVFLISLALISIPVKNLAYVVPMVYLLTELFAAASSFWRVVLLMAILTATSSVALMADAFMGKAVNVPGCFSRC